VMVSSDSEVLEEVGGVLVPRTAADAPVSFQDIIVENLPEPLKSETKERRRRIDKILTERAYGRRKDY
jgi:hypothetical protein